LTDVEKALVFAKVEIMEDNPYYPSLRTQKMKKRKRYFESSVNMDIRIIWEYKGNKTIFLIDIGHHNVLKKY